MLNFRGKDQKAKQLLLHYAKELGNAFVFDLVDKDLDLRSKEEAVALAEFYWAMLDKSAEDKERGVIVLGELDLQYWMERLMNIIGGHLSKMGYEDQWNQVCDDA